MPDHSILKQLLYCQIRGGKRHVGRQKRFKNFKRVLKTLASPRILGIKGQGQNHLMPPYQSWCNAL